MTSLELCLSISVCPLVSQVVTSNSMTWIRTKYKLKNEKFWKMEKKTKYITCLKEKDPKHK